jgi:hypothetical protein
MGLSAVGSRRTQEGRGSDTRRIIARRRFEGRKNIFFTANGINFKIQISGFK